MTDTPIPETSMPDTSIIVCTLDRLGLLADCLASLDAQTNAPPFEVIVVDNTADPDGNPAVRALAARHGSPAGTVHYVHAPGPNLSIARNAGLDAATGRNIAFVDDDLVLPPGWLATITAILGTSGADGVLGEVRAKLLPGGALKNLQAHFDRTLPIGEGAEVPRTRYGFLDGLRTCNVIVRRAATFGETVRFDPAFGRSGGEDQDVFITFDTRPFSLIYSSAADAIEQIPADRQSVGYLTMRAFRNSQAFVRVLSKHSTRPRLTGLTQQAIGALQWARARAIRGRRAPTLDQRLAEVTAAGKVFYRRPDLPGPYR
ncbi:MAG: glycosyltransferase family A protein [Pseudomonadota bacterium]